MTEQPPGLPEDLSAGAHVAGYRLEERIGQGGMAVVFRAYDQRLDRMVALKILAPALAADDAFRQRFIRESRAAAAVDDPHIIPVFEAGEADGVLFIAMRFVRGGDVRSLVDRIGPLPGARAAEIISQAASALDAAHARGLVHRDVKPANMLLGSSLSADRPDHVYLSDFGLSKGSLAITGLTATGQFLGTLDYVAPEQIEGTGVDGRTDQYALACSAFELLAGEPPFRREDSVSVMYAQLNAPPPPLRPRRPDLPDAVDDVLASALAKAPADRYASCRDFAAALRLALGVSGAESGPRPAHSPTEIARPVPLEPSAGPPTLAAAAAGPGSAGPRGSAEPSGYTDQVGQGRDHPAGFAAGPPPGRRAWWRSPVPVAGLCAVVLLAGGGAYALASRSHDGSHGPGVTSVSLPGCTTATASAPTVTTVTAATVPTGGSPFGVAVTPDGAYSFVTTGNAVQVLKDTPAFAPAVVRTIAAQGADKGDTLTHDGKFLVAADGTGAVVINVAAAETGAPSPVAGSLTSPHGGGAAEVLISANDEFAFVTLQNSAEMAVFNLARALSQGFSSADFVGYVPLGQQPVGLASDGTWLYVANIGGTISVVNLAKAEASPAAAVVATDKAGCGTARAILSADHKVLWVTARQSDELLAFSAKLLRTDPGHALLAKVMVGEVPLGETLVDHGAKIVVADSNLNGLATAAANLAVVDTARALAGKPALLGYVPAGLLPRQLAVEPGGATLLVTEQGAHRVQALRIAGLP